MVGLIVIMALAYFLFRSSPPGPMGENISADEEYLTSQIVASALSMVNMSQKYTTAHPLPGYPPKVAAANNPGGTTGVPPAGNTLNSQPYRRDVHRA